MTPKEKAKELFDKFNNIKFMALICIDEIIESEKLDYLFSKEEINSMEFTSDSMWVYERFTSYWQEVQQEIEKL